MTTPKIVAISTGRLPHHRFRTQRIGCTQNGGLAPLGSTLIACDRVTILLHGGALVGPADSLMLDAKQAILDEQHRKFQVLQKEGRWPEAMQQFHVTLTCASDVLTESLQLLERVLETRNRQRPDPPPDSHPQSS